MPLDFAMYVMLVTKMSICELATQCVIAEILHRRTRICQQIHKLIDDEDFFGISSRDVTLEIDGDGPACIANRALRRSERVRVQPSPA